MIIALGGPDGCGKTTIAKLVVKDLRGKGYPVAYTWLRYPRFFSLIPLLLSRLLNLTIVYEINGVCKHKYHDFRRVAVLGALYELLLIIDYMLYKFIKVTLPRFIGYIVVVDRYILDVAVDLLVERGSLTRFTWSYISREMKQPGYKEIIMADEVILLHRRRDNRCNPYLGKAVFLYKYLSRIYGASVAQNNSLEDLSRTVVRITSSFRPTRVYADVSNQLLRALFLKHKLLIYLSNFLFQGIGYMWRVELAFRVFTQVLVILLLYAYLGLSIPLAILVSHTISYMTYSNVHALYKWVNGGQPDVRRVMQGLCKLSNIERAFQGCLSVYIVGSLAREPALIFKKRIDIDARIVPGEGMRCLIISLLISLYLRVWSFLRGVPLDLYIKPISDKEFQKQSFASCSVVLEKISRVHG